MNDSLTAGNIMKRKRHEAIECHRCQNTFSRRHLSRHRASGECESVQQVVQPTVEEQREFLRKFAEEEFSDFEKEASAFVDNLAEKDMSTEQEPDTNTPNLEADMQPPSCTEDIEGFVAYMANYILMWQSSQHVTDTAVDHQLKFLSTAFKHLGKSSQVCQEISEKMPSKLKHLRQLYGKKIDYVTYVVCPKCKNLYKEADCVQEIEGKPYPKPCPYVEFPNNEKQVICGEPLLEESNVCDQKGHPKLVPIYEYHYQPLKSALRKLLQRPGFAELCEMWRNRRKSKESNILSDVYDGQIWEDFEEFFREAGSLGLMLNVDFFQPYEHVQYSVGAIYLVCLNLPIQDRFKKENIILVGLIPKFDKEPPLNPFLKPLVDDLITAWEQGFMLPTHSEPEIEKCFKCALLCSGCDIPASRKVCGFLGHMACLGCNKCLKEFPGRIGEKSYGGFDRENWPPRDPETHRKCVELIEKTATTITMRKDMESQHGVRYSVLLELEYFDPIRMSIIDPMHNLFLGVAKHHLRVWKDTDVLKPVHFTEIQQRIDTIECPSDVGKIPHKIASGFNKLNADQLKNWTLLFSMSVLRDIVDKKHLKCWQKFALACKYLCSRVIDGNTLLFVDGLLLAYCQSFEKLYGADWVTPNMHLVCHLIDSIKDFGPIYGFWLFSFERYNGILGSYSTNKRSIEGQLFKRFLSEVHPNDVDIEQVAPTCELTAVMKGLQRADMKRGSLLTQGRRSQEELVSMCQSNCIIQDQTWEVPEEAIKLMGGGNHGLSEHELDHLRLMYKYLYPDKQFEVCTSYLSPTSIYHADQLIGSSTGRSIRSSTVYANWCSETGDINTTHLSTTNRPGTIEKFVLHKILLRDGEKWHILAKVNWYASPSEAVQEKIGDIRPSEAWSANHVDSGPATFIPVQRLKCKAVKHRETVVGRNVIIVCARQRYLVCD